jgi:hypothetical protein
MKSTSLVCKIVISLLLLFSVCGEAGSTKALRDSCKPTWRFLSKQHLSAHSGAYTVEFSAILIGCENELRELRENEMAGIQEGLKRFLGEKALRLIGMADSRELRTEVIEVIRKSLGRPVVTDVFFSSLAVGESM